MNTTALKIPGSRTNTPNIISPHPKQVISLEDWEAKAPLSDSELKSVDNLQTALKTRSLPLKEPLHDVASSELNQTRDVVDTPQRLGTPGFDINQMPRKTRYLRPERPIQSPQEFYEWFSTIEHSVAHSQEAHYRHHLATAEHHLDTCDQLIENVDSVRRNVDEMLDGWRTVESGGRSLKDACEQLLDERDRLIKLAEDIGARSEYFQELEHATRMLNHPGESLVLQADFLEMVERVDICIDFLRAHRYYREADVYLLRFQQCLTRAMTLIKMYFVGSLKALTSDIIKRIPDKEISSTAQLHLLYTRFQSVAAQVAPLIGELERRTRAHPEELAALLAECHSAYFNTRKSLLVGKLAEEIKGLDPTRADLVELTRAGCSYLKQLCIDEFSIYRCFFNSGKDALYAYLESLCDYLYDDLRPRILHEPRLSVLCNVCKVLQALMVLDVPEADSSSDEEDTYDHDETPRHVDKDEVRRLHISHMLRSVLQDAQTRLFFKAQAVVQAEIKYYVPKSEDLEYPERLQDVARRFRTASSIEQEAESPFSRMFSFGERWTWYTPLQTMITVLSQLREFIQPSIFDDIAQESIEFCRINLVTAANMIAARASPPAELDAQLFLIRHLLVLKEMNGVLNLANRDADVPFEFRHVTDTLRDLLRNTNFMPYAFASTLSKTRDEASATGTKEGIDGDLKRACESVIQFCARSATQPIQEFMLALDGTSASSSAVSKDARPKSDAKLALATQSGALEIEAAFRAALEREVPQIAERLRLYLASGVVGTSGTGTANVTGSGQTGDAGAGTVSVLLGHVQDRVADAYFAFRRAAEFLPAEEAENDSGDDKRAFASPDDIRTLFKALC